MQSENGCGTPVLLSTHDTGVHLPVNTKYASTNPITRLLIKEFMLALVDFIKQTSAQTILDVGCGEGMVMRQLGALRGLPHLQGVDIDTRVLHAAMQIAPHGDYLVGSIYNLPFSDDCYDLLISTEVLEHLRDARNGLSKMARSRGATAC